MLSTLCLPASGNYVFVRQSKRVDLLLATKHALFKTYFELKTWNGSTEKKNKIKTLGTERCAKIETLYISKILKENNNIPEHVIYHILRNYFVQVIIN